MIIVEALKKMTVLKHNVVLRFIASTSLPHSTVLTQANFNVIFNALAFVMNMGCA